MPVIDAHVHLYPAEVNADPVAWATRAREPHWAKLCTRKRKDGRSVQDFPSTQELVHAMDVAGVDRAVLLGWYWEQPENARWQNRFFAECLRVHPKRLSAFAAIHPHWSLLEMQAEFAFARASGFCGIGELSPHSQGIALNSPSWRNVLELAAEFAFPVNIHVTEPDGRGYPGRVDTPLPSLVEMIRAHPKVVFILAHWGGRLPLRAEHGQVVASLRNVFFDTAASPLIYPPSIVKEMLAAVGPERILWGTDYPLRLYPTLGDEVAMASHLAEMRQVLAGTPGLEGILGGNAAHVLGLK